ncbi:MAG: DUF2827 family protein [Pseudomonadales bacterium]
MAQLIFGNGLSQNVKFLYDLLKLMGHEPYFLVGTPAKDNIFSFCDTDYRAYTQAEVIELGITTQLALEAGVTINQTERAQLREAFSTIIVSVRYGHTMFMDMEQLCHAETLSPGLYVNKPDAVWASPHFENSFSYLETLYDAPVFTSAYIWEPDFVADPFTQDDVKEIPDIFVMEPNISLLKNALIPLTIIERMYRDSPDSFGRATITNGMRFNEQPFFLQNLVRNMSALIAEANKVYFSNRASFDDVFRQRDVLLGHQWGCELNYLYMEAFYKNVPLVHNSDAFKDAGYYYPEFRADIGKEQLEKALTDSDSEGYHDRAKKVVYRHSIHNPEIQKAYQDLINTTLSLN